MLKLGAQRAMQLIDTQKDSKNELKALETTAIIRVYVILEFIEHTLRLSAFFAPLLQILEHRRWLDGKKMPFASLLA